MLAMTSPCCVTCWAVFGSRLRQPHVWHYSKLHTVCCIPCAVTQTSLLNCSFEETRPRVIASFEGDGPRPLPIHSATRRGDAQGDVHSDHGKGPGRVVLAPNQEGEVSMQPWIVKRTPLTSIARSTA